MLRLLSAARAASATPIPASVASSLHHHLLYSSAAAAATESTAPFIAEEYLVTTCGLTPAQAAKSSKYLAHLRSPSKPDAVLAFFAEIGLAKADITTALAREARLLCCKVDKTLAPIVNQLLEIGFSPPQISRLMTVDPKIVYKPALIPRLAFYLSFLGSYDKVYTAVKANMLLLGHSVEHTVQPNIDFLRGCGLADRDIADFIVVIPKMIMTEPERLKDAVARADKLGVPRDSAMFKYALAGINSVRHGKIDAKFDCLKKALECSEGEVHIAVRKLPMLLTYSDEKLSSTVEFLKMEVGLDAQYIVQRPAILSYSVKKRLMPRHYVLKVLKEKGLVDKDFDYYSVVSKTEKIFVKRFLDPFKESVPGLADSYAAACAHQVSPVIPLDSLK